MGQMHKVRAAMDEVVPLIERHTDHMTKGELREFLEHLHELVTARYEALDED